MEIFFGSYAWNDIALTCSTFLLTFLFYGALLAFVSVGIADYYRRYVLLSVIGQMIDPSPDVSEAYKTSIPNMKRPQFIDLSIPHNIPAWFAFRQVLTDLGYQYRERVSLYSTYVVLLALGLTAGLVYQLAVGAVLDPIVITAITWNALSILLPICSMTYNGTRTNEQFDVHIALLMRIRLSIREIVSDEIKDYRVKKKTSKLTSTEKQLQSCDLLLGSSLEILTMEKLLNPIKILGFPASFQLVQGIGSLAAGALASGASLVTKHQF